MIDALEVLDGTFNPVAGSAITVTRRSINFLDFQTGRDKSGGALGTEINVAVMTTFTGGTSLQISAQFSADATTWVDELDSPVYPVAALVAGAGIFKYKLPQNQLLNAQGLPLRYFSLNYTVVGTFTAGSVMSYLSAGGDRQNFVAYPGRYSIDA